MSHTPVATVTNLQCSMCRNAEAEEKIQMCSVRYELKTKYQFIIEHSVQQTPTIGARRWIKLMLGLF